MISREQKIVVGIGVALIFLGVVFLALQLFGFDALGTWVPLISGIIVLVLAVATRLPGFSILGCLLTAGGAGLLWYVYGADSESAEPVLLLFISGGLFCIPILTRVLDGKPLLWPLIPGIAGLLVGVVLLV